MASRWEKTKTTSLWKLFASRSDQLSRLSILVYLREGLFSECYRCHDFNFSFLSSMGNDPKMEKTPEEKGTFYQELDNSFLQWLTSVSSRHPSLSSVFRYAGPKGLMKFLYLDVSHSILCLFFLLLCINSVLEAALILCFAVYFNRYMRYNLPW